MRGEQWIGVHVLVRSGFKIRGLYIKMLMYRVAWSVYFRGGRTIIYITTALVHVRPVRRGNRTRARRWRTLAGLRRPSLHPAAHAGHSVDSDARTFATVTGELCCGDAGPVL